MIIAFILLIPLYLVVGMIMFLFFIKNISLAIASKQKNTVLTDETQDSIIKNLEPEITVSVYDYKMLALRKSIAEYFLDLFQENFVAWEPICPHGLLKDNPIKVKVFLRNEVKNLNLLKLPCCDGFKFSVFSPDGQPSTKPGENTENNVDAAKTEETATSQSAQDWINTHLEDLENLREKAIKDDADYFTYHEEIPENLKQEIQDILELNLFRLVFEDKETCVYI